MDCRARDGALDRPSTVALLFELPVKQGISGRCQDEQTVQALGRDNLEIRTDGREFWQMFKMPLVIMRARPSKRLRE